MGVLEREIQRIKREQAEFTLRLIGIAQSISKRIQAGEPVCVTKESDQMRIHLFDIRDKQKKINGGSASHLRKS